MNNCLLSGMAWQLRQAWRYLAAGYGKALDDRSPLYGILVYKFSIKAAPEEKGADIGGRRAAHLSTRAIQMSARTALLAVLTVRLMPSGPPAWLFHAVLPAANPHTDDKAERASETCLYLVEKLSPISYSTEIVLENNI